MIMIMIMIMIKMGIRIGISRAATNAIATSAHPDELGDRGGTEVAAVAIGGHALAAGEAERHVLAGAAVQLGGVPAHLARGLEDQIGLRRRRRRMLEIVVVGMAEGAASGGQHDGGSRHVWVGVGVGIVVHSIIDRKDLSSFFFLL
jgi:hypothetical protein